MKLGTVEARDGTAIAYRDEGSGPALVFTSGYTSSDFYWERLLPRFRGRARLITWDLKGHGRSEPARDLSAVRVEDSVDDLRRVLDACGVERGTLLAFSLGCPVILEAWRHIHQRITGLVPMLRRPRVSLGAPEPRRPRGSAPTSEPRRPRASLGTPEPWRP